MERHRLPLRWRGHDAAKPCGALAAALVLTVGVAYGQQPPLRSATDLDHFLGWFASEYDNNEQVWQRAGLTQEGSAQ